MGKMRAYLPYVGYMTILLNDYPMFKYFVLGMMAFFTIIAKDPQWIIYIFIYFNILSYGSFCGQSRPSYDRFVVRDIN